MNDEEIRPHTDAIVNRMFTTTADQNYILARVAFVAKLDWDFFWLSLHALEKYMKATLLLNGLAANRNRGHDLIALYKEIKKIDRRLEYGPFVQPPYEGFFWREITVDKFLVRLNAYGSPDNRYNLYGYTISLDDLFKVDQLIWSARRLCKRLKEHLADGDWSTDVDWIDILQRNPERWSIDQSLPLEKLLLSDDDALLQPFVRNMNFAFAPDHLHQVDTIRLTAHNPPLVAWFDRLKSNDASIETKETSAAVLGWVKKNIKLSKNDAHELDDVLAAYRSGRST
ncbi:hypothetical protein [Roseiterribacter gracilis]|uniref:HEPN domain-containing protein n=1 Tax=Roseiterribacter gracilis TaxID=2812848 RepID=A0A8S8X6B6_9PROT|nr:hypothetical protein TMPK1_03800 [Rhodospirillales bacterium TMPK1]